MMSVSDDAEILAVSHQATTSLVKQLEDIGILIETTGYGRNRFYMFARYFELFMK